MAANGDTSGPSRPPTHGRYSLMRGLSRASRRTMLDQRTTIGKALAAWRAELLADLGGIEAVSTQELALVEEAVKTKLMLDSIDAWLLQQPTLIMRKSRAVLPAVRDRQALVSTLRGLLNDLGLKRRAKAVPSLGEYLSTRGTAAEQREKVGKGADDEQDDAPSSPT